MVRRIIFKRGRYDTGRKVMFDLDGYLIIKNVLTPQEVKRLNEVADATFVRDYDDPNEDSKGRKRAQTSRGACLRGRRKHRL